MKLLISNRATKKRLVVAASVALVWLLWACLVWRLEASSPAQEPFAPETRAWDY